MEITSFPEGRDQILGRKFRAILEFDAHILDTRNRIRELRKLIQERELFGITIGLDQLKLDLKTHEDSLKAYQEQLEETKRNIRELGNE